jgi:hypothetical protein
MLFVILHVLFKALVLLGVVVWLASTSFTLTRKSSNFYYFILFCVSVVCLMFMCVNDVLFLCFFVCCGSFFQDHIVSCQFMVGIFLYGMVLLAFDF